MTTRTPSSGWLSRLAQGSLVKQILIGLVLGVLLALVSQACGYRRRSAGDPVRRRVKAVAPVLVLMLVMASIANHQHGQKPVYAPFCFSICWAPLARADRGVVQFSLSLDPALNHRRRQHHAAVGDC